MTVLFTTFNFESKQIQPFNAWYPQKGNIYLNKPTAESYVWSFSGYQALRVNTMI